MPFTGNQLTLACSILLESTLFPILGDLVVTSVWTGPSSGVLSSDNHTQCHQHLSRYTTTFLQHSDVQHSMNLWCWYLHLWGHSCTLGIYRRDCHKWIEISHWSNPNHRKYVHIWLLQLCSVASYLGSSSSCMPVRGNEPGYEAICSAPGTASPHASWRLA